jgi:acetoin:2,6-dichlorophenolindophenol oxidoreductase subunit alpha
VTTSAPPALTRLDPADLDLMLLIRHFELALLNLFDAGELFGTTHTCLGQEYIPVALRPLLGGDDYVLSNHRGHGHYLARFADPHGLLAEIMGREGAVCRGVGGSQHILRGRYLSTGVQGQSAAVAVGTALHLRRSGSDGLSAVYVGDGTWGEGVLYEALNMARLWQLPLLVIVEHNGIAQSTPTWQQMAGTVAGRAAAFEVEHTRITSLDVNEIRAVLAPIVSNLRSQHRPVVVEFATHRVGPHSKGDDTRDTRVIAHARANDWYRLYPARFPDGFAEHDDRARLRIAEVVAEVRDRPPATWEACGAGR